VIGEKSLNANNRKQIIGWNFDNWSHAHKCPTDR